LLSLVWVLLETLLLQGLAFLAMAFRKKIGPCLVYALAVSSYFLANLSASLVIQKFFNWQISLGSTATFVLVLFLILFFYEIEGIKGARRYFQVVILSGLFQIALACLFYFRLTLFPYSLLALANLPLEKVFLLFARTTFFSLLAFFLDGFLIILLYSYLTLKFRGLPSEIAVFLSLILVLWFDSFLFVLTNFYSSSQVYSILAGHLVTKSLLAACFSSFYFFLKKMYGFRSRVEKIIERLPLAS
jgi:uncharacterized PurR-regulated membrane protein YhhQ (DUF165 family)